MEYNLSPADARKAFDALGQAYDMRNPGSNLSDLSNSLSDSNDYSNQAQSYNWKWKDYLLVGSGLIILCGGIYLATQSIKTGRSEEHTSELQSLMRISYAVFCLKKKTN